MTIADTIISLNMVITDNNTDVFVLVIGESAARTDNMSIYGYSRPTTPELQKQKSRLKLLTEQWQGHLIPLLRYRWHYLLIPCCIMMFAVTPIILSTWRIRRGSIWWAQCAVRFPTKRNGCGQYRHAGQKQCQRL